MEFSVLIPTFNRRRILSLTLDALENQQGGGPGFEVIVVDDGSSDGTAEMLRERARSFRVPLLALSQPNRKQGAARNLGAREARGRHLVFLGDDTVPQPDFLAQHRLARDDDDHRRVVIGYTPWAREYPRTRFMEYIGEYGWQFGFKLIEDPDRVPFNFFYTSNLSISLRFFREAGGFDESFTEYGWEDMELGLRLERRGMRLVYNPQAVAYHHHPTAMSSFIRRQYTVGRTAWTFYRKHPDLESFLNVEKVPQYSLLQRLKMELLTRLCCATEHWRRPDLSRFYPHLMTYHYNRGILAGRHE